MLFMHICCNFIEEAKEDGIPTIPIGIPSIAFEESIHPCTGFQITKKIRGTFHFFGDFCKKVPT